MAPNLPGQVVATYPGRGRALSGLRKIAGGRGFAFAFAAAALAALAAKGRAPVGPARVIDGGAARPSKGTIRCK